MDGQLVASAGTSLKANRMTPSQAEAAAAAIEQEAEAYRQAHDGEAGTDEHVDRKLATAKQLRAGAARAKASPTVKPPATHTSDKAASQPVSAARAATSGGGGRSRPTSQRRRSGSAGGGRWRPPLPAAAAAPARQVGSELAWILSGSAMIAVLVIVLANSRGVSAYTWLVSGLGKAVSLIVLPIDPLKGIPPAAAVTSPYTGVENSVSDAAFIAAQSAKSRAAGTASPGIQHPPK